MIKIYLYLQFVAAILAILRFFTCRHKKVDRQDWAYYIKEDLRKLDV